METHFLIDGMLSGSGVRDAVNGGYVEPSSMGISASLVSDISAWHRKCEDCHFAGFPAELVAALDAEGMALAARAAAELPDHNISYFSDGLMKRLT